MVPTPDPQSPEMGELNSRYTKSSRPFFHVTQKAEEFSAYSHLFGASLTLVGMFILVAMVIPNFRDIVVVIVYGLSTAFLFMSSFLYHSRKAEENEMSVRRKLDHIAIFVMIAGTYTPLCALYLEGAWLWGMLIAQWLLVAFGIVFKLLILNTPRALTIGVYLAQGWMAVLPIGIFARTMLPIQLGLVFAGGILYSIGALVYKRKRPDPVPGIYGFHEIFHTFILLAAACHYTVIFMGYF